MRFELLDLKQCPPCLESRIRVLHKHVHVVVDQSVHERIVVHDQYVCLAAVHSEDLEPLSQSGISFEGATRRAALLHYFI
jgi:hypothetical protein